MVSAAGTVCLLPTCCMCCHKLFFLKWTTTIQNQCTRMIWFVCIMCLYKFLWSVTVFATNSIQEVSFSPNWGLFLPPQSIPEVSFSPNWGLSYLQRQSMKKGMINNVGSMCSTPDWEYQSLTQHIKTCPQQLWSNWDIKLFFLNWDCVTGTHGVNHRGSGNSKRLL